MNYGCPHCRDTDPEDATMHDGAEDFTFAVVCSFCLGSHECTCNECLGPATCLHGTPLAKECHACNSRID